jgi:hypothetical protein
LEAGSGELTSAGFGGRIEEVVEWLGQLPGPARAVHEAGPAGFALYRAARAAEVAIEVVAPGKTPRPPGDRVKTDSKDAELVARLAMAGQPTAVSVPSEFLDLPSSLARTRSGATRPDALPPPRFEAVAGARTGLRGQRLDRSPPPVGCAASASTSRRPSTPPPTSLLPSTASVDPCPRARTAPSTE